MSDTVKHNKRQQNTTFLGFLIKPDYLFSIAHTDGSWDQHSSILVRIRALTKCYSGVSSE
jgi:hypothetical protein